MALWNFGYYILNPRIVQYNILYSSEGLMRIEEEDGQVYLIQNLKLESIANYLEERDAFFIDTGTSVDL